MTYAYDEMICGFQVLPFPEKPGYLSISDEEFRQKTLAAWSQGGYREKITAALRGGEREWAMLYNDSDTSVRAAVACRANEAIQMKMITDPEPVVRKLLARYSTDKVRTAAIKGWEIDKDVLAEIAKWGNSAVKQRAMELALQLPETLKKLIPHLTPGCIKRLEIYPDKGIRYEAAMHGGRAQCERFLDSLREQKDMESEFMRDNIRQRLNELHSVKKSLFWGRARTIKHTGPSFCMKKKENARRGREKSDDLCL